MLIAKYTKTKTVKAFLKANRFSKKPIEHILNRRDRLRYRLRKYKKNLEYPRAINIETTNYCNEKCWFCPRAEATRGFGLVSIELVKRIVDEGVPYGPITYFLHKDGEPLMHPQILEIMHYIKSANFTNEIILTTNGSLLKEKIARGIIEVGVDAIRIGIRAATPETYCKIHKRDHFNLIKENTLRLLDLKERLNAKIPEVVMQIVVCDDTKDEIDLFIKTWENKPVSMEIKDFMSWGGWTADETLPPGSLSDKRPPCIDPFHNIVINWDGKVSLCSLDWNHAVPFGDITKQSIKEVWHDKPVNTVREAHLRGNYTCNSMCANCDEWRYVPNLFWKNRVLLWKDQKWL